MEHAFSHSAPLLRSLEFKSAKCTSSNAMVYWRVLLNCVTFVTNNKEFNTLGVVNEVVYVRTHRLPFKEMLDVPKVAEQPKETN